MINGIFGILSIDKKGREMKIVILGSTGMLGNTVGKYFLNQFGEYNIFLSYRNVKISYGQNKFFFDAQFSNLWTIPECDYIINCIGVIKPFINKDTSASIQINSSFPRILANHCRQYRNIKLIHITTDCVFSGKEGLYTEESLHDCTDIYGKTKSLGEPNNCMVLRTSIVGEEIHKNASLVSWIKSQKGKEVNGFTNHLWNGITTKQYARICEKIIKEDLYEEDIFHIFSPEDISKCALLNMINKKFDLQINVVPTTADQMITRTLRTVKNLNDKLDIPSLDAQVMEM